MRLESIMYCPDCDRYYNRDIFVACPYCANRQCVTLIEILKNRYFVGCEFKIMKGISKENPFCPRNCFGLSITEGGQDLVKCLTGEVVPHECLIYKIRLIHGDHHPEIYRCGECLIKK